MVSRETPFGRARSLRAAWLTFNANQVPNPARGQSVREKTVTCKSVSCEDGVYLQRMHQRLRRALSARQINAIRWAHTTLTITRRKSCRSFTVKLYL